MIKSMTGYSRNETKTDFGTLVVELKAWNHRYCNVTVRVPDSLSRFEYQIQSAIRNRVSRGQVQASIELVEGASTSTQYPVVNIKLAEQYYEQLLQLQKALGFIDETSVFLLVQLPGVLTTQEEVLDEKEVWLALQPLLESALDRLETTKQTEGAAMLEEIQQRLQSIQFLTEAIESASANLVEAAHARLEARLNELFEGRVEIDPDRLAVEAGVIAARSDITEELVRLDSHCSQ
ncbi:MAG: hypothetical protein O7E52_12760, partial [Candidatus Poribacteria bacterium]|nr:hypothetical protein [Candidatus Poribacteria bacterium]